MKLVDALSNWVKERRAADRESPGTARGPSGADRGSTVHRECRRCGTTLDDVREDCPTCGSTEIATVPL